jgi:carboxypeptidase Q
MRNKSLLSLGLAAVLAATAVGLPRAAQEPVDTASIEKIKGIGLNPSSSQVMEIASYLTDVYGPRLTGSPNIKKAGDWSVAKMKEWGLTNVALEPWPADPSGQNGGFPCGWTNEKFYLAAKFPQAFPIRGTPSAWSPGTNGLVSGEVVIVTETTEDALRAKYKPGALKGKWVISATAPEVRAYFTAPGSRYTAEQLDRMENPPPPDPNAPGRQGGGGRQQQAGAPPAAAAAGARAGAPAVAPAPAPAGRTIAAPAAKPAPRKDACAGGKEDPEWRKAEDARLAAAAAAAAANPDAAPAGQGRGNRGGGAGGGLNQFNRNAYFKAEGVLGTFSTGQNGHGLYTIGGASRNADPATQLPAITIAAEEYGRIFRMVTKGVSVVVEADIRSTYNPMPPMFNVVGEIRGTDKADEIVMLGAHFDSWHASTGATDNAAGSAAMLEAMRILKASGVKLRRTVRIGLWTGEEQGLIGSARYVNAHFGGGRGGRGGAGPTPPTPDHAKFAGYFNIDNGTGAIRGVYLQSIPAVGPIFRAWMAPFKDIGMTHLAPGNTGGTDHGSFINAGLPGWQFIQDGIEYNSMTHHTNLDSYERLQAEDMRKNATIAAAFAFLAANRDQLLPRPTPAAPGAGRGGHN